MDRTVLCNMFVQTLQKMTLHEFAHLFINEVDAIEDFYKLTNGVKAGNTISLLFNPHRLSTDTEKDISVYASLQDEHKLSGLARLYLYNVEHKVNNPFYSAIQRGYENIQYVNEFPPFVARQIYDTYIYTKNKNPVILDPCCGWGGRMIGCASFPNTTYIGCEPCTETYEGLCKLGEWLKILQPTFSYKIYKVPFEDAQFDTQFDFALTSPPYYNTEHYSSEPTNSLNRYTTFESWVDGFYSPLIVKTLSLLKEQGLFVLNIGDRKYNLSNALQDICNNNNIFCERINDYLSGNGENKEKFYLLSRQKINTSIQNIKLF